jgi:hypothetical protein
MDPTKRTLHYLIHYTYLKRVTFLKHQQQGWEGNLISTAYRSKVQMDRQNGAEFRYDL